MRTVVNAEEAARLRAALERLLPFVTCLTGSAYTSLQWRVIPERPGMGEDRAVSNRRGPINNGALLRWLVQQNDRGCAIYVNVNEYPDEPITAKNIRGLGRKENIVRMRAAHVDIDIAKGNAPSGWQRGDVADGNAASWPAGLLVPSMQIDSFGGPHLYWVYRRGEEPTVPGGEGINHAVQQVLNADPHACDASRILRAPGFFHWKTGTPQMVGVAFADPERVYSAAEMADCLAALGHPPHDTAQRVSGVTADGEVEDVEMTRAEYKRALKTAVDFALLRSATPKGQRGATLMKTICPRLHDLGIRTPDALKILRAWADKKCDPSPSADGEWPVTDETLMDRWVRSASSRDGPRGSTIFEWRGGISSDFEAAASDDAPPAPPGGDDDGGDDGGDPPAPPPPPGGGDDDEGPGDEPPEEWIEQQRMDRVDGNTVPIPVRRVHRRTIEEVLMVLSRHPDLYQFDGNLAHLQNATNGWRIRPLTKNSVLVYITDHCAFFTWKLVDGAWEAKDCGPPPWLVGEVLDCHRFDAFRHLKGITMVPRIRADGSISPPGYDADTATVYLPDEELRDLTVGETREEALAAIAFLTDVVADFPIQTDAHRAAAFAAMLTPFCRRAQNGPAPMFMVDGNRPNVGKSYLLKTITSMFGLDVVPLNWAPPDKHGSNVYQNTQRISSAFQTGRTILALDNLSGAFGDIVIDKLLTLSHWSERVLGSSETFSAENHMTVLGTANNVTLVADVWRRVVPIRLVLGSEPRPPPRHELTAYLPTIRKRMIEACLTILRAFYVAGRPLGSTTLLGSFENWSRWVSACLVWLDLPDVSSLVSTVEDADEDTHGQVEREALFAAVEAVCIEKDKQATGITAQELTEAIEKERTDPYIVDKRFAVLVSLLSRGGIITRDHVAVLLRRHRDNGVRHAGVEKVLVSRPDPHKRTPTTWRMKVKNGGEA